MLDATELLFATSLSEFLTLSSASPAADHVLSQHDPCLKLSQCWNIVKHFNLPTLIDPNGKMKPRHFKIFKLDKLDTPRAVS